VRLAFFQPDIPQNLGAGLRLARCFSAGVDVIEPCAFPLTDKRLKRAAMDYGGTDDVTRWPDFDAFAAAPGRIVLLTTSGAAPLWSFVFSPSDRVLLGSESAGVPCAVHDRADARLVIPIAADARSLNLVTAGAIALGEAARQGATGADFTNR